jgi:hypothetical protein
MTNWQEKAALRFPNSARRGRIFGDGPFVLAIGCGKPRILLYPTKDSRLKKLQSIDLGCGYECRDVHDTYDLTNL